MDWDDSIDLTEIDKEFPEENNSLDKLNTFPFIDCTLTNVELLEEPPPFIITKNKNIPDKSNTPSSSRVKILNSIIIPPPTTNFSSATVDLTNDFSAAQKQPIRSKYPETIPRSIPKPSNISLESLLRKTEAESQRKKYVQNLILSRNDLNTPHTLSTNISHNSSKNDSIQNTGVINKPKINKNDLQTDELPSTDKTQSSNKVCKIVVPAQMLAELAASEDSVFFDIPDVGRIQLTNETKKMIEKECMGWTKEGASQTSTSNSSSSQPAYQLSLANDNISFTNNGAPVVTKHSKLHPTPVTTPLTSNLTDIPLISYIESLDAGTFDISQLENEKPQIIVVHDDDDIVIVENDESEPANCATVAYNRTIDNPRGYKIINNAERERKCRRLKKAKDPISSAISSAICNAPTSNKAVGNINKPIECMESRPYEDKSPETERIVKHIIIKPKTNEGRNLQLVIPAQNEDMEVSTDKEVSSAVRSKNQAFSLNNCIDHPIVNIINPNPIDEVNCGESLKNPSIDFVEDYLEANTVDENSQTTVFCTDFPNIQNESEVNVNVQNQQSMWRLYDSIMKFDACKKKIKKPRTKSAGCSVLFPKYKQPCLSDPKYCWKYTALKPHEIDYFRGYRQGQRIKMTKCMRKLEHHVLVEQYNLKKIVEEKKNIDELRIEERKQMLANIKLVEIDHITKILQSQLPITEEVDFNRATDKTKTPKKDMVDDNNESQEDLLLTKKVVFLPERQRIKKRKPKFGSTKIKVQMNQSKLKKLIHGYKQNIALSKKLKENKMSESAKQSTIHTLNVKQCYVELIRLEDLPKNTLPRYKTNTILEMFRRKTVKSELEFTKKISDNKPLLILNHKHLSRLNIYTNYKKYNLLFPINTKEHFTTEMFRCKTFKSEVETGHITLVDRDILCKYLKGEITCKQKGFRCC